MHPEAIDLNTLPKDLYDKIPLSIKSYKSIYKLNELPPPIQDKIKDYFEKKFEINYNYGFDTRPNISEYSDLEVINTVEQTVVEYLKNFFFTLPGEYPFNCVLGSKLKYYLQTKDTSTQRLLIDNEVNNIVEVIKSDFDVQIEYIETLINTREVNAGVFFDISIVLKINDKKTTVGLTIDN